MRKLKINPLSLFLFFLFSILLLLVQFGYISPIGVIVISPLQYAWLFWFSVIAFIVSTANLVSRIPRYAQWSTGYRGEIVRTVKNTDSGKDYFIRGKEDMTLEEVLQNRWPFKENDQESKWYLVDELGNDVTTMPLGSINETVRIIFLKDEERA
ncbi:MAG: hypothetical protein ACFFDV_09810 [Candidatus Thorarchaeota archaeon]